MGTRPQQELQLSFGEKVSLAKLLMVTFFKIAIATVSTIGAPREAYSGDRRRNAYNVFCRTFFPLASSKLEQAIVPETIEPYTKWCKEAKVSPAIEMLADGTSASWIGSKQAKTILLYFHGGGYNLPPGAGHFQLCEALVREFDKNHNVDPHSEGDFAALSLHMDLAPFHTYPRQLSQAVALFNHVRTSLEVPPERIFMAGDSAGGNLVLQLLSHVLHRHPDEASVPAAVWNEGDCFKGAILICPWTDPFKVDYPAMTSGVNRDCIAPVGLKRWAMATLGDAPTDAYILPLSAPSGWWKGIGSVVKNVLQVGGRGDVLIDSQEIFAKQLKEQWDGQGSFDVFVDDLETHISCINDPPLGVSPQEISTHVKIREWVKEKIF
ncbi:Alpha/Beta hydrolase protein [Phyllosticta capitalensis]|uniref:Alpha/Beta hydrolase protein n=1 Tax=Phyllosticta capitalensis TaxID=121624 RepID=A0ABR1Z0G3_9PEZI